MNEGDRSSPDPPWGKASTLLNFLLIIRSNKTPFQCNLSIGENNPSESQSTHPLSSLCYHTITCERIMHAGKKDHARVLAI